MQPCKTHDALTVSKVQQPERYCVERDQGSMNLFPDNSLWQKAHSQSLSHGSVFVFMTQDPGCQEFEAPWISLLVQADVVKVTGLAAAAHVVTLSGACLPSLQSGMTSA